MVFIKTRRWPLLVLPVWLLLAGCYKDKTVILDTGGTLNRPVTFAGDIVPLFNKSCNGSGCHAAGGVAPNLTSAGAYLSLTSGNYINKANPENSELYQWMTGKRSTPMPLSGPNKDYNALVLTWIKQGALNN